MVEIFNSGKVCFNKYKKKWFHEIRCSTVVRLYIRDMDLKPRINLLRKKNKHKNIKMKRIF